MSAVIVKNQELLWARGFGYSDVEKRAPATADTLYYVASLTKTFATTVLMQLVEQGRLDLEEPMSRYSNEFKDDSVKVKHLLSHTSGGMPGERFRYDGARFSLLTAVIEKKTGKSFRQLMAEMFLDPLKMSNSLPSVDEGRWKQFRRPSLFERLQSLGFAEADVSFVGRVCWQTRRRELANAD